MTAGLKPPYSKLSFRNLQETRTTWNFKSTKQWKLQTSFKNKAIRKLSSYQLSSVETEVLTLGLNFVPTSPAYTHHLVQKLANDLIHTVKNQFHFQNQPLTWIPNSNNQTQPNQTPPT